MLRWDVKRTIGVWILAGSFLVSGADGAEMFFDSEGFEYNAPGSLAGTAGWMQVDSSGNNAHPDWVVVQNAVAYAGKQALALRDTGQRNIARLITDLSEPVTVWDGFYRSHAANDFGAALMTFRTDDGEKSFKYDFTKGSARWFDVADSSLNVAAPYGEWSRLTVQIDLAKNVYAFFYNQVLAFSGRLGFDASRINSLEIDVLPNDSGRLPKGEYAFYIDKLTVSRELPFDAGSVPCSVEAILSMEPADMHPVFPGQGRLLDAAARLPGVGEKRWQFSSCSRESRYDEASGQYLDWGWNQDYWCRRTPDNVMRDMGGRRFLLADVEGPGTLNWIWTAVAAQPERRLNYPVHIYLDDMETPAFSGSWHELLDGSIPGLDHGGLAYAEEKTFDSFIPMPFQKRLRIIADRPDDKEFDLPSFYILAGQRFPDGTRLPLMKDPGYQERLRAVSLRLTEQDGGGMVPDNRIQNRFRQELDLAAGREQVIFSAKQPGAILCLKVRWRGNPDWKANAAALRSLVLEARWDGASDPAVWAPLDAFFGMSPGLHPCQSYPFGAEKDGTMYCYFPMPYRRSAELKIRNLGAAAAPLSVEVITGAMPEAPETYGYFHARWHQAESSEVSKDRWMDKPILHTTGRGRLVGVHLHVWNPLGGWWGEGDEKIFVDGERFPSAFGTGTEDFLGFCYGYPGYKVKPFHNVNFNQYATKGHQSLNRYLITDSVPFQKSIDFYLERYNPQVGRMPQEWVDARERTVKLTAVPYWYGDAPFRAGEYRTYSAAELTGYCELEPKVYEPGAVEMETLPVTVTAGKTRKHYWSWMEWSGDTQLVWEEVPAGAVLSVPVSVEKKGTYALRVRLNRHPGYGAFELSFNGETLPVDLDWDGGREWTGRDVDFKPMELKAGTHMLKMKAMDPGRPGSEISGALDFLQIETCSRVKHEHTLSQGK